MIRCIHCLQVFTITDSDIAFYKKIQAPDPKACPDCRMQKRMSYRNERALYPTTCGLCKKSTVSIYNPTDNYTVYCSQCWWSDQWDAEDYAQTIDWNRSLIDQWDELRKNVPRLALVNMNSENSEYTNMSADNKDCYLLFASENCENCSYGKLVQNCKDCFDCSYIYDSELCYGSVNLRNCYRGIYLEDCENSRDCGFSIGLRGCNNVFLSSNLHNKEYYIANEPVPQEEYADRVAELMKDEASIEQCKKQWRALREGRIVKYANLLKSPDCTGDNLVDCKRVYNSYDVTGGQDSAYVTDALDPRDCYDASFIYYKPELIYDSLSMLQCYNVQFSVFTYYTSNSQYCDQVHNSKNVLLSSCMRGKEYMILNKRYSETEYTELRKRIIEKMTTDGEYGYLPDMQHSAFAYNDTVAYEYFPLTKAQASAKGLRWNDAADEVVNKPFNITKAEQTFYSQLGIPEPKEHPELRHRYRMSLRNPRQLWERACDKCGTIVRSTYEPGRPEQVYCEPCYQKIAY